MKKMNWLLSLLLVLFSTQVHFAQQSNPVKSVEKADRMEQKRTEKGKFRQGAKGNQVADKQAREESRTIRQKVHRRDRVNQRQKQQKAVAGDKATTNKQLKSRKYNADRKRKMKRKPVKSIKQRPAENR